MISNLNGTMYELDPETGKVEGDPVEVGALPRGVAAGLGSVWVALGGDGTVARIDPSTHEAVGEPIAVGDDPADVALAPRRGLGRERG